MFSELITAVLWLIFAGLCVLILWMLLLGWFSFPKASDLQHFRGVVSKLDEGEDCRYLSFCADGELFRYWFGLPGYELLRGQLANGKLVDIAAHPGRLSFLRRPVRETNPDVLLENEGPCEPGLVLHEIRINGRWILRREDHLQRLKSSTYTVLFTLVLSLSILLSLT